MKKKILQGICIVAFICFGILFVIKFGGSAILKLYVQSGVGDCRAIPILCKAPEQNITAKIDEVYLAQLIPYKLPELEISAPKGFTVIKQSVTKVYYKRKLRDKTNLPAIYLLTRDPGFFITLFPNVKNYGITDDFKFIKRTMNARFNEISNLNDAFFVIMKGIFIPDLGDQDSVTMAQFSVGATRGFINYSLGKVDSYFDCNVFDSKGNFVKIYVKDLGAKLDLEKVLTIISTIKRGNLAQP